MIDKLRKKLTLEDLMCIFICICPILDMLSFLFRNYFKTNLSPTTALRPIIPCIVFIILFFKEKNKKKKIIVGIIYLIYSTMHLILFQKLQNGSSYGNWINEMQYILNYSIMIINLYIFNKVINDKEKIEKSVIISLTIYMIILFISIITKTSSSTYLEGIGYKGYFESGNSLCTVLILSLCIIFGNIHNKNDWKKLLLFFFTGVYLIVFSGMRTGLFGFSIIVGIYLIGIFLINIRDRKKISKIQLITIILGTIVATVLVVVIGSTTLERRKLLKQNELSNIDEETLEKRYVSGDILNLYKKIVNNDLPKEYMSEQEKKAIVNLCEYAKKVKLSNVNLRAQQFIYNIFLVKEQKSLILILFGNGYKNQTGELVMEMEIPALICNFGVIGFILYLGPFLAILLYGLYINYKNIKYIQIDTVITLTGCTLAFGLSAFSGYVYFNFSSMTMAIILSIFLLKSHRKEPASSETK